MKSPRSAMLIRQWRVFAVLFDGRAHSVQAWEALHIHPKTLHRDLQALVAAPELKVVKFNHDGRWFWRCDNAFVTPKPAYARKYCSYHATRVLLPLSDFHKLSTSPDGHKQVCKECSLRAVKEWRAKNPQAVKKRSRAYYLRYRQRILEDRRTMRAERRQEVSKDV